MNDVEKEMTNDVRKGSNPPARNVRPQPPANPPSCAATPCPRPGSSTSRAAGWWSYERLEAENARLREALKAWSDAYAAFRGAFDTPAARLRDSSEYSEDARKRMYAMNDSIEALAEKEGGKA